MSAVGPTTKGFPGGAASMQLRDIGEQGWNLLREDLPLPLLVLKQSALQNNLTVMQRYCANRGLMHAPHGKTTMAPQLVDSQLRAGAWAVTLASAQQAQVFRAFGCRRILVANQVISTPDLRYLAGELRRDESFKLLSWVDSPESVTALVRAAQRYGPGRPWQVLVEIGWRGGRTGARGETGVDAVVRAARASDGAVVLVGVALFEGLLGISRVAGAVAGDVRATVTMDQLLERGVATAQRLHADGDLPDDYVITGGGSTGFDVVARHLARAPSGVRKVLRAGCYLTHDHGMNEQLSPLSGTDHRAGPADGVLHPALELWTYCGAP